MDLILLVIYVALTAILNYHRRQYSVFAAGSKSIVRKMGNGKNVWKIETMMRKSRK
jgi:hypothetical protein